MFEGFRGNLSFRRYSRQEQVGPNDFGSFCNRCDVLKEKGEQLSHSPLIDWIARSCVMASFRLLAKPPKLRVHPEFKPYDSCLLKPSGR